MAYTFDNLFAADPSNPTNVAANASILLYDPADPTKTPVTITDPTGSPIPNPATVNKNGFGPAMQHATLDRLAWEGGGFSNFITSYEGIKNEAVSARTAAQEAAANAQAPTDEAVDAGIERADLPAIVAEVVGSDPAPAAAAASAVENAMANQHLSWTLVQGATAAVSTPPTVSVASGTLTYTTGKSGQAAAAGVSVQADHSTEAKAAIKTAQGFTVECWMKAPTTAAGTYTYIFSNGQGHAVAIGAGGVAHAAPANLPGTKNIADDQWHHVALVVNVDSSTGLSWTNQKVYVDGVLDITIPGTTSASADWLLRNYIGGHYSGANGLRVSIDEFRLSRGIRYTGTFTPATTATVDADTLFSLHFDGNTTPDLSAGYPARPAGAPGGAVTYVGTAQPTTWLTKDRWINA